MNEQHDASRLSDSTATSSTSAPEIVLAVWGLLVLLVDLGLARRMSLEARRRRIGLLSLLGVGVALVAAAVVCFVPLFVRGDPERRALVAFARRSRRILPRPGPDDLLRHASRATCRPAFFNLLYVALLGLVVGLSMAWSFTEDWGEYFALLFWATVGMMLLTAAEELLTLFLTLETMTICLYLSTALEKTRRRSAEGGLKYFVYGSVSSALFLFGLSLLYGLTGTTQFDGDPQGAARPAATAGPGGQRRRGDGGPADAGRLRVQGRGGAVPPVGARRLRRGARRR